MIHQVVVVEPSNTLVLRFVEYVEKMSGAEFPTWDDYYAWLNDIEQQMRKLNKRYQQYPALSLDRCISGTKLFIRQENSEREYEAYISFGSIMGSYTADEGYKMYM